MPNDLHFDGQDENFTGGSEPKPPLNRTDKNQKIAIAGLIVFAVLIVGLWSVQLKNSIYGPLNGSSASNTLLETPAAGQTASDLALKNKDTDGDDLNDYDELNLYRTSPYLADSDSDGAADGAEIKKGDDPNCPIGRTCAGSGFNQAASGTPASSADILNNLTSQSEAFNSILNQFGAANSAGLGAPAAGNGAEDLTADQKNILKNIDAAGLRQMLIGAGMPKETLDQVSDAELMKSYSETLNSQ